MLAKHMHTADSFEAEARLVLQIAVETSSSGLRLILADAVLIALLQQCCMLSSSRQTWCPCDVIVGAGLRGWHLQTASPRLTTSAYCTWHVP